MGNGGILKLKRRKRDAAVVSWWMELKFLLRLMVPLWLQSYCCRRNCNSCSARAFWSFYGCAILVVAIALLDHWSDFLTTRIVVLLVFLFVSMSSFLFAPAQSWFPFFALLRNASTNQRGSAVQSSYSMTVQQIIHRCIWSPFELD